MTSIQTFEQARDRKTSKQQQYAFALANQLIGVLDKAGQPNDTTSQWALFSIDDLQEMLYLAKKGQPFNVQSGTLLVNYFAPVVEVVVEEVAAPVVEIVAAPAPIVKAAKKSSRKAKLAEIIDEVYNDFEVEIDEEDAAEILDAKRAGKLHWGASGLKVMGNDSYIQSISAGKIRANGGVYTAKEWKAHNAN